jgi:hypothetical protein
MEDEFVDEGPAHDTQTWVAAQVLIHGVAPMAHRDRTVSIDESTEPACGHAERSAGGPCMIQFRQAGQGDEREKSGSRRLRPSPEAQQLSSVAVFFDHCNHTDRPKQPAMNREIPRIKITPKNDCRAGFLENSVELRKTRFDRNPPLAPNGMDGRQRNDRNEVAPFPGSQSVLNSTQQPSRGLDVSAGRAMMGRSSRDQGQLFTRYGQGANVGWP